MDASTALILIEALLIILAAAVYKANGFISPSPHAFTPVPSHISNNHGIPESTVVPSSSEITVVPPQVKYEVFLSFRGEDTRDTFTAYLYDALCKAKIHTFIDNRLGKGEQISPVLLRTIEESQISVVIFSKDYASSTWCLDELKKIVECKQRYGRTLIPVFYDIDPSIVRKQSGSYGEALVKLEQRFMDNMSKIKEWKSALTEAANLSGWDSSKTNPEEKFVKKIVIDICTKLNRDSSYDSPKELVGIEHHVKDVKEFLSLESPEVRTVGICGMGGIGKTTIAQVLFDKLKPYFESHSFVANIRENLTKYGVDHVVNKCLSELLDDKDIGTYNYNIRSSIVKNRLGRLRILLVLDDVDNSIHVEDIIKVQDWCGIGSRIILTSRDKHVLENSGAYTYNVPEMSFHDALQLFSLNAFKQNKPIEDYSMVSERAVDYCGGIPLAIKVLGSFLYGRSQEEWESALQKLEQTPQMEVFNVLKLSFDGLDEDQKKMFLDMASFSSDGMQEIYRFYDFKSKSDMAVLRERCLISYHTYSSGVIVMHDLVKAMGQQICRCQFNNEPKKPIRLWNHKEIYRFLKNNEKLKRIECMSWDTSRTERIDLEPDVFGRMRNLRFLEIYWPAMVMKEGSTVFFKSIDILPEELIILQWEEYPLPYVPLNFCAENLVILKMPWSDLVQLWDGDLQFPNLKKIDLQRSSNLCELPDLCQTPNIEEIDVSDCTSLLQIYSSGPLHKLSKLLLDRCRSLKSVGVSKLEQLWDGSPSFPYLSEMNLLFCENLVSLVDLSETPNIRKIDLRGCRKLVQVHSSSILAKLESLDLVNCEKLRDVNVGGNMIDEGTSSSVLEVVFNLFDLGRLSFIKVSVKVFMCDDGGEILLSGFGLKVEYSESEEIKSLAQSLSSLLPSAFKLRWIDITKSSDHYDCHFQTRFPYPVDWPSRGDIREVVLERREANVVKWGETSMDPCSNATVTKQEEEEYYYEEEEVRDPCGGVLYKVYNRYKIVRFPEGINCWSSLLDSEALKSLGECDCTWFQPNKDLTFSVNTATGGTHCYIYHRQKLCQLHSTTIGCNLSFTARMLRLELYDEH